MRRHGTDARGQPALAAQPIAPVSHNVASNNIPMPQEAIMPATAALNRHVAVAHHIVALAPQVGVEAALRAVATIALTAATQPTPLASRIARIEVAMPVLRLCSGATQFVLARAGLLGSMTLADHEALRFAMWRKGLMPQPAKALPSKSVLLRPRRLQNRGYVRHVDRGLVMLVCDTHLSCCAVRADFIVPKVGSADFIPWRLSRPGGYVVQADGSTIIFSRDEIPMWHVTASGAVRQMEPWEAMPPPWECHYVYVEDATCRGWSSDVGQQWALALLARHGIQEPPLLVDVLPYLMGNELELEDAVKVMQADPGPWPASQAA